MFHPESQTRHARQGLIHVILGDRCRCRRAVKAIPKAAAATRPSGIVAATAAVVVVVAGRQTHAIDESHLVRGVGGPFDVQPILHRADAATARQRSKGQAHGPSGRFVKDADVAVLRKAQRVPDGLRGARPTRGSGRLPGPRAGGTAPGALDPTVRFGLRRRRAARRAFRHDDGRVGRRQVAPGRQALGGGHKVEDAANRVVVGIAAAASHRVVDAGLQLADKGGRARQSGRGSGQHGQASFARRCRPGCPSGGQDGLRQWRGAVQVGRIRIMFILVVVVPVAAIIVIGVLRNG